jgi:hypothetical protein
MKYIDELAGTDLNSDYKNRLVVSKYLGIM